jgi:hypothetical protein
MALSTKFDGAQKIKEGETVKAKKNSVLLTEKEFNKTLEVLQFRRKMIEEQKNLLSEQEKQLETYKSYPEDYNEILKQNIRLNRRKKIAIGTGVGVAVFVGILWGSIEIVKAVRR